MKMRVMMALCAAALVACGGGGNDSAVEFPPVTYHDSGGLRWSSTTSQEVKNPTGLGATLEMTAQKYCSRQTCDQNNANCRWTNFNGEPGWRVPSLAELQALYARTPNPPGWVIGRVWSNNGAQGLNFTNGQAFFDSGLNSTAKATCVKPA